MTRDVNMNSADVKRAGHQMKPVLMLMTALLALVLAGCVGTLGDKRVANDDLVSKIVVGKSTKADVRTLLGEPANALPWGENEELWIYQYTRGQVRSTSFIPVLGAAIGGADSKTATLSVRFSSDGIVKYVGQGRMTGGGGGLQDINR